MKYDGMKVNMEMSKFKYYESIEKMYFELLNEIGSTVTYKTCELSGDYNFLVDMDTLKKLAIRIKQDLLEG
jgi:hypothetical protein